MRCWILGCVLAVGCAKAETAPDPLSYLRVGVDPAVEAQAVAGRLAKAGYEVGHRVEGARYVAFDARRGAHSTVRVITLRGPVLSVAVPDARAPARQRVALVPWPRRDFDGDAEFDVIVALVEPERTCFAWVQVDKGGFVREVFRPKSHWGELPCVRSIGGELELEVNVPDCKVASARVRFLVARSAQDWTLLATPTARAHWEQETTRRTEAIARARAAGDSGAVERLACELRWFGKLSSLATDDQRVVPETSPMLEPGRDGEE